MTKKPKLPKKRNPVARQVTKMRTKVKPNKKKNYPVPGDQPTTKDVSYNNEGIL